MLVPSLLSQVPHCPVAQWREQRVWGSETLQLPPPAELLLGGGYLGLPCLSELVCSVDVEIIAASGRPASAKLLQHSQGLWGFLVPKSCMGRALGSSTFWQVFSGVIGKEFPVAVLVRTEETQFLQHSFVPPRC